MKRPRRPRALMDIDNAQAPDVHARRVGKARDEPTPAVGDPPEMHVCATHQQVSGGVLHLSVVFKGA